MSKRRDRSGRARRGFRVVSAAALLSAILFLAPAAADFVLSEPASSVYDEFVALAGSDVRIHQNAVVTGRVHANDEIHLQLFATIDGDASAVSRIRDDGTITATTTPNASSISLPALTLDEASARSLADRVVEQSVTYEDDEVVDDVLFVNGDVRFRQGINGKGTVIATGEIRVDHAGQSEAPLAESTALSLVAFQDIRIDKDRALRGVLYTLEDLEIEQAVQFEGVLVAAGRITINKDAQVSFLVRGGSDTTRPAVTILEGGTPLADGTLFNRPVVPTIQIEDESSFDSTALLDGQPFVSGSTIDTEGVHTLAVTATDIAGNSSAVTVSFEIDLTPPVFVSVTPVDGTITAAAEATLEGVVEGASAVTIGGAPAVLTGTDFSGGPFALAEGDNTFLLVAVDAAENEARLSLTLVRDTISPDVSIASPSDGTILGSSPVTVTGSASDPHLDEVRVNGGPAALSGSSFSLDGVALSEGTNTLTAVATDLAGNTGQAQVEVTLDTTAPTLTITNAGAALADGFLTGSAVVPVIEATDATGATVTATLNGAAFASGTPVAGGGIYTLVATATDAAGNSTTASVFFEIDLTPPAVTIDTPAVPVVGSTPVTVTGTASDSNLAQVEVNGVPATISGNNYSAPGVALVEGLNTRTATATDLVGNTAQATRPIVLDTQPPVIRILNGGVALADGLLTNQPLVPVIEVDDATAAQVDALLNGGVFSSGTTVSQEGVYSLAVTATDEAGNASSATVSFELDLTPPVFISVQPADGTVTGAAQATLTGEVEGAVGVTIDGAAASLVGQSFTGSETTLSEGLNTFLLRALDAAGNVAELVHTLELDTTPPAVTIDFPAATVVGATPVTVSGTAVDLHLAEVTVNGVGASQSGSAFSAAAVVLVEGANTLTAIATDTVGNTGQAEKSIVLDTVPPVIRILNGASPLPNGFLTNQTVVPVIEVDDATATQIVATLNGASFLSGAPVSAEGIYSLAVTATDEAGNSAAASVGFEIDLTPPVFVDMQPSDGSLLGVSEVSLTGQVEGANAVTVNGVPAALTGTSFTAGPLTLTEGDNTLLLAATDAAGNRTQQNHRLDRDTTPPSIDIAEPLDGATLSASPIRVAGSASDPNLTAVTVNGQTAVLGAGTYFVDPFALVEGPNTLQAEAVDGVGNTASADATVNLDTVPPVIRILESGSALPDGRLFNRAVVPVVEVDDATATTVESTLNGQPFVSGTEVAREGLFQLDVTATDAAGNVTSAGVSFEIDLTPPVFVSFDPAAGAVLATGPATITGVVQGATELTVDGRPVALSGETLAVGPVSLLEGANVFLFVATDAAGNQADESFTLVLDSTPPVVAIAAPAAGSLLGETAVDVSGTVEDERLASVTVNGIVATVTGSSFLAQQVPLAEGANTLIAAAEDEAGNTGDDAVAVTVDTLPPTIQITDPAAGTLVSIAVVTLAGTASDPHLDRVEVNGVAAALDGLAWTLEVALSEGPNAFTARAYDRLGHSAEDSVTVLRDSTAPNVLIQSPTEGALLNSTPQPVSGTVDDEPGLTMTVNGLTTDPVAGTFTVVDVPLVEGENRLIARATDPVGNEGVHSRIVFLDTVPPEFMASDPASGALAIAPEAPFTLSFSEELDEIAAGALRLTTGGVPLAFIVEAQVDRVVVRPDVALASGSNVDLELTAGLTDRAGNALANPQTLTFTVADVAAPSEPIVDPLPVVVCSSSATLSGTAEPGVRVVAASEAGTVETTADGSGFFSLVATLVPARRNVISVTARDEAGNTSAPVSVAVTQDCQAPQVVAARRDVDLFHADVSESIDPASAAGAVTLTAESGAVAGAAAASADGRVITFTPSEAVPEGTLRFAVSQAVRDLAGNPLAYPFAKLFGGAEEPTFVTGTVIDDSTGRPLTGAQVTVVATDGIARLEPLPEQTTSEDGRFSIPLPVGTHTVLTARSGYTPVFRVATTVSGLGHDLFDPRPTPASESQTLGSGGGTFSGAGGAGGASDVALSVPAGALGVDAQVSVTGLTEQGLPALLPYGWSPRGAAWVDLGGATLAAPAALTLPVESADGVLLAVVELDMATLQWRTLRLETVENGEVHFAVSTVGGYAAVEADSGALAPIAPPPAETGAVLGSSMRPTGGNIASASLTFSPEIVLPAQTSQATTVYTMDAEVPSGLPLTLFVREELQLLDGGFRIEAPFEADLVLYHDTQGGARSRFRLQPSRSAQLLPIQLGHDDVTVSLFRGETVRGNVLGPVGGTVTNDHGDTVDLPAGSFDEPTAVILERRANEDLPLAVPSTGTVLGVLSLDIAGKTLSSPASLAFAQDPPSAAGATALLLQVVDLEEVGAPIQSFAYRPIAELEAGAGGWATRSIDPLDLAWSGVLSGGLLVVYSPAGDVGFFRGTVFDVGAVSVLAQGLVSGSGLDWIQITGADGRYALPAPVQADPETREIAAESLVTGSRDAAVSATRTAGERVDLDIVLQIVAPEILSISPGDGATSVPAGVEPTVSFSEPVDPASLAAGITLLEGVTPVEVAFSVEGALVRVLPTATLMPGVEYELRVGAAVRDLQGFSLVAPATVRFTTLRVLGNEDVDLTRIILIEPDEFGMARVVAGPGAAPAGALVFVENTTSLVDTPSLEAGADGSFELEIETALTDRLLLHVLIEGSNELILWMTPFRTSDLKGAFVGPDAVRYVTGDGIIVTVEEGTFDEPTEVRVEPAPVEAASAPAPREFQIVAGLHVDFGGARAKKGLRVSMPAPPGLPDSIYLLSRVVLGFEGKKWQMDDIVRLDDGRLTTEDPPVQGTQAALVTRPETVLAARTTPAIGSPRAPRPTYAKPPRYFEFRILPAAHAPDPPVPPSALPGMWSPRTGRDYFMTLPGAELDFTLVPTIGAVVFSFLPDWDYLAMIAGGIQDLVEGFVAVPHRRGEPFQMEVRDLATGYLLFSDTFDSPPDLSELQELPVDLTVGDSKPPGVVSASSPIALIPVTVGQPDGLIKPAITVTTAASTEIGASPGTWEITITGAPDAVQAGVKVRLVRLGAGENSFTTSGDDGSFMLNASGLLGAGFLVSIGATVLNDASFEIEFSEALAGDLSAVRVVRADGLDAAALVDPVETRERVVVKPNSGWQAGEQYKLVIGPELADAAGNPWNTTAEVDFEIEQARQLGGYQHDWVQSSARVGNLLFLAGVELYVVDASDPAQLEDYIPGGYPLRTPGISRGVAVDPHRRVVVASGGDGNSPGFLHVIDPLVIDPAREAANPESFSTSVRGTPPAYHPAVKGGTLISNGGGLFSNLPEGQPRRLDILSNDDVDEWVLGQQAPGGVQVESLAPECVPIPEAERDAACQPLPGAPPDDGRTWQVTVTGTGGSPELPVTLEDVQFGRWDRVDAGLDGSFTLVIQSRTGSRLRLLKNRQSIAYVAVSGAGVGVVDVNAFYNEDPGSDNNDSQVLNYFNGSGMAIRFCGEAATDTTRSTNVVVMYDPANHVPLAVPTSVSDYGVMILSAPTSSPSAVQPLSGTICGGEGDGLLARLAVGLKALVDFPFDLNGNGRFDDFERERDYLVVGHLRGKITIWDVTERESPVLVSNISIPGGAIQIEVDRESRRIYAAGYGSGVWVIDIGFRPVNGLVDADGDAQDDRLLEQIEGDGNTKNVLLLPDLGIIYMSGLGRDARGATVSRPLLKAVAVDGAGGFREIDRIAPYGVPTVSDAGSAGSATAPGLVERTGTFRLLATLPNYPADELKLDVVSLGPGGVPIPEAGDSLAPTALADLPKTALTGDDGVVLRRQSSDPVQEGYNIFLSEEIKVTADLRAAREYQMTDLERDHCTRCEPETTGDASTSARELLSGYKVAIRIPTAVRQAVAAVYSDARLDASELELASVPWDLSPASRQEPTVNPSYGHGEVAPGTLLHSGEFSHEVTDLAVKGRGFDFAFSRTYRSQTVGAGPLGPGWDHSYRQRLRELPNGNVEYFDGRGRRETFAKADADDGAAESEFDPPPGRFAELKRTATGWILIDARRNIATFDRFGRLEKLADSVKESEDTGNEMFFEYDAASNLIRVVDTFDRDFVFDYDEAGRLVSIRGFDGRDVLYEYDTNGRLTTVSSPDLTVGEAPLGRLVTEFAYEIPTATGLTLVLNSRDNMTHLTDARGTTWLENVYEDKDGDSSADEVGRQTWGGNPLTVDYAFTGTGATTTVTDRRQNSSTSLHDADGHLTSYTDQEQATTTYEYDPEGLVKKSSLPRGRTTEYVYDVDGALRSRGNAIEVTVTPDSRGFNGSSPVLTTTIDYHLQTNQPIRITDPRGAVTEINRSSVGLPKSVTRALGQPEASTAVTDYNAFGQPTETTNPNGNKTTFKYFETGARRGYLREAVVSPGGLALTTSYETDARGNVIAVSDPRGVRHTTEYNELDWRVASTQAESGASDGSPEAGPLGYRSRYLYDRNGNLEFERVPLGEAGAASTENRYIYGILNELRITEREIAQGGAATLERRDYDENYNLATVTLPEGNVTQYAYHPRNLLEKATLGFGSPDAVTDTYVYNADRERTTYTNGRSKTWTTEYDGYGRVKKTTDPVGNYTASEYDNNGNPEVSGSYAPGDTLLASGGGEYDLLNRKTATIQNLFDAGDPETNGILRSETTYDPASNVRQSKDFEGRTTAYDYDTAERLTQTTDPAGNRMVWTLDANGNAIHTDSIEKTAPGSGSTGEVTVPYAATFDALNRRLTSTDALDNTTRTAYDARSNVIRQIDPEGFLTTSRYDGLDRMSRTVRPEGISVDYEYDNNSRLRFYTDALGNKTEWAYDALDRKTTTTYPDQTSESYVYDAAHNVEAITDANGSTITQTFDPANRLTVRSVTPGSGVEGIANETYGYDGLYRVTQADSSGTVTSFSYDSLFRMTSEGTALGGGTSKTVSYVHDRVGSVTRIGYPSGHEVTQSFDSLDRPLVVAAGLPDAGTQVASYGYRGPDLIQTRGYGNGVAGTMAFDAAKRAVSNSYSRPGGGGGGAPAFSETIAWSPRNLKVETTRGDLGGRGFVLGYDEAGRVTGAGQVAAPTTTNNSTPDVTVGGGVLGAGSTGGFSFAYDQAENLLSRSRATDVGTEVAALPLDDSKRNRPGQIGTGLGAVALGYDPNGNLTQKGDKTFHYDYRNRLSRVTDASGAEVASYTYDAFNRRVAKTVGGQVQETIWGGWQNLENYLPDGSGAPGSNRLASRRTYGVGLDEITRQETDVDGDGSLETVTVPLYDSTGNLVLSTGPDGRTLERYEYSPYGGRKIYAGFGGPAVEQIRRAQNGSGGELWVELSKAANPMPLEEAVTAGTLMLSVDGASQSITVSQPVTSGRQAKRRMVVATGGVSAGANVLLTIPAEALVDESGNTATAAFTHNFSWPASEAVILDTTGPRVAVVAVNDGTLEIQLSEEADLASAASTITLDGAAKDWSLSPDRYTLSSTSPLGAGSHDLLISGAPLDLAGLGLASPLALTFTSAGAAGCAPGTICASSETPFVYEGPEPDQVSTSTVGNLYGFHGRPIDPETGLVYFRNRYYDPELGRFISTDPMGYMDGPSMYQYGINDPFNKTDPMGEEVYVIYRDFNIDGLRERYPDIGHVYLAYDGKGLANPGKWRDLVEEIGGQKEPERRINPEAETFSFHPWKVREMSGVQDSSNDFGLTVCTGGSFVGYNDEYDQRTFQGREGGSLQAEIVPLGVSQDVQERMYRAAIASRNVNNKSPLSGDIGTYKLGTNNCGTWAKNILESNRVAWPDKAQNFNQGLGLGGKWDTNPRTGGMIQGITKGMCIGGLVVRQIGEAVEKCKGSWDAGWTSSTPTPAAPLGTPPICGERGCVDPVTQRPAG